MMLKLEIFRAKFNAHFCQYQQGSPQKRLLRFERSADCWWQLRIFKHKSYGETA